jgi:hypothetical protein
MINRKTYESLWKNGIKINLKEVVCEGLFWTWLVQYGIEQWNVLHTTENSQVS